MYIKKTKNYMKVIVGIQCILRFQLKFFYVNIYVQKKSDIKNSKFHLKTMSVLVL